MSVSVEVCKDIEQFQETVVAGMDAKHTLFAIAGLLVGCITGGVCHFLLHAGNAITMYAVMLTAIPIIFIGFLDKDGMGIMERLRRGRRLKKEGILYNKSTESPECFKRLLKQEKTAGSAEAAPLGGSTQEQMKKQMKLLGILGGAAALLLIAAIAAIIVLKK